MLINICVVEQLTHINSDDFDMFLINCTVRNVFYAHQKMKHKVATSSILSLLVHLISQQPSVHCTLHWTETQSSMFLKDNSSNSYVLLNLLYIIYNSNLIVSPVMSYVLVSNHDLDISKSSIKVSEPRGEVHLSYSPLVCGLVIKKAFSDHFHPYVTFSLTYTSSISLL